MTVTLILLILVLAAGFYMSWNIGANDVANAIGTSVGSGALRLRQAVIVAAILEFAGAFFFGSYVTGTIQKGIIDPQIFSADPLLYVFGMLSALLAAGVWLQLASYYGWPVSTTHTIVGAVIGFGAVAGGIEAVQWDNITYILISWVLSPLIGGVLAYSTFNILRKQIFYTRDPVASAKRMTPVFVFIILSLLSMVMIFNGLKNVDLKLTFLEASLVSIAIATLGALVSRFLVRKVQSSQKTIRTFNPELVVALGKARKHLRRVQASCQHEMVGQVTELVEEVEELESALAKQGDQAEVKSDYAIVENIFSYLQIISVCMMAFAHGANDVANAIGPLAASISVLQTGLIPTNFTIPVWTLAFGGVGIVLGLATWGWRVVETIGKKITELTPTRGFSAELGAAATIVFASRLGLPVSTTHTLVGAVIGVGLARGIEALDLSKTRDIFISWTVTVPAGAGLSIAFFFILKAIFN